MRSKLLLIAALLFAVPAYSYERICELVVQESALADAGTYTDFAVLFTIDNFPSEPMDSDGSFPALSTGNDLEFWSDAAMTAELTGVEIVQFTQNANPALATLQLWLKCTPDGATDTSVWVTWDGVTDNSADRTNPWGAYVSVWHFEETDTTAFDSTTNNNDLSFAGATAPASATGKVGNGLSFDGTSSYLNDTTTVDYQDQASLSISFWALQDSDIDDRPIISNYDSGNNTARFLVRSNADGTIQTFIQTTGGARNFSIAGDLTGGGYHHVVIRTDSTNGQTAVFNGVLDAGSGAFAEAFNTNATITGAVVGYTLHAASSPWNGDLDEMRVRLWEATDEWSNAEYNTMNSPATFVIEGTPSDVGGGFVYIPPARRFGHADL